MLKRFSNGRRDTIFQKVLALGCGMVLNYLESFLVRPRVIICDGSGDIGYDFHRHVAGICCAKFFPFYDEWLQLIGRIQRIAVDIPDPGSFVVAMPCHCCTFEQVLFMKVVKEQMDVVNRDIVQDPQADNRKTEKMRQKRANELSLIHI